MEIHALYGNYIKLIWIQCVTGILQMVLYVRKYNCKC